MNGLVSAKRSKPQLQEIAALLNSLYEKAEYGTWNEWAADAGVHPTQVSGYRNAEAEASGYNLLKLLEAASRRIGLPLEELAKPSAEGLASKMDAALENQERMWAQLLLLANAVGELGASVRHLRTLLESPRTVPRRAGHNG